MSHPLTYLIPTCPDTRPIQGLSVDSRTVKDGYLFAAFVGTAQDGRAFIPQALAQGAHAILLPTGSDLSLIPQDVTVIEADNPRAVFAQAAARFYGHQPACISAVTGTNGKSSCVTFIRQLWEKLGQSAASLGTLGITAPNLSLDGGLTTPDANALHAKLAEITDLGVTHLAMEASSHGLDQHRLDGVDVTIAAFTNLSRDHLDYHGTMDAYLAAKSRLFTDVLAPKSCAVLNADSETFDGLKSLCAQNGHRVLSYGYKGVDIRLISRLPVPEGQRITFLAEGHEFTLTLPLVGTFQVENALCSLGVVMASGIPVETIVPLLSDLDGVPGRMETMGRGVYVDFAHTPDALDTVLSALKDHTTGRLGVVFGCGGDRDRGKRAQMGAIAARYAQDIYVTDDNPRSEDPGTIRAEIMTACPKAQNIGDRRAAITTAIQRMKADDILIIAGKGHEKGQIINGVTHPFDDRTIAREVLSHVPA